MKTKLFIIAILFSGTTIQSAISQTTGSSAAAHKKQTSAQKKTAQPGYFTINFQKGDKLANIYSRAIAFTGDDFAPLVFRVSGSSTYEVLDNNPLKPRFNETDLYDGRPESSGVSEVGMDGKGSYNGNTFTNTSASGLLYSELVWGHAPSQIKEGDSWQVDIAQPWELGGVGKQTVTVMVTDAKHNTITLKREGSGSGFFDGDQKQIEVTLKDSKKVKMNLTPGACHWIGLTTFKNGIVLSDELLVTRPVNLESDSLHFKCNQREYILLNAMPAAGL